MIEVRVPDIGDFTDVPVIEIHVAAGDEVAVEDPLVTLESDKATMDVPAPGAGTVSQLRVVIGDRVSEGSVLLTLESLDGTSAQTQEAPAEKAIGGGEGGRACVGRFGVGALGARRSRTSGADRVTMTPRWS